MARHWSVPHVVAVSVILAVAVLEGGSAGSAAGSHTAVSTLPTSVATIGLAGTATDAPAQLETSATPTPDGAPAGEDATASTRAAATVPQVSQAAKSAATSATTGSVTPRQDLAAEVADAANAERAAAGITPLTYTSCSVPAAWAVHLASTTTLTHNSLTSVLSTCGGTTTAGENIAVAYTTAAEVTAAWMTSPGHQANILNRSYTTISVGVAQAADGTYYWVEDFTG